MEVESVSGGIVQSLLVQQDEEVMVGQEIAIILSKEQSMSQENMAAPKEKLPSASKENACSEKSDTVFGPSKPRRGLFAKNKEKHLAEASVYVPMSSTQGIVAKRMQQSKQTVPHFYLQVTADAEAMAAVRNEMKKTNPGQNVVWDAFFVQAAAKALEKFERMKCRWEDNKLIKSVNNAIGVAVDIDGNLYVIPIKNPLTKDITEISSEIISRVEEIQAGEPEAKKLEPANITISNLGGANIELFYAIVNPPEAAILAIGKIAPTPCVIDNEIAIRNQVKLSLSIDHRVVSGKYAADFLNAIIEEIQNIV
jgi:pyruvate dehydrogenase E2 component (dihydrolipoamide acetyltransferase)